jgi:hypothetical protein
MLLSPAGVGKTTAIHVVYELTNWMWLILINTQAAFQSQIGIVNEETGCQPLSPLYQQRSEGARGGTASGKGFYHP